MGFQILVNIMVYEKNLVFTKQHLNFEFPGSQPTTNLCPTLSPKISKKMLGLGSKHLLNFSALKTHIFSVNEIQPKDTKMHECTSH